MSHCQHKERRGDPIFNMEWVRKIRWWEHIILIFIPYVMITWENSAGKPTYYKIWRGKLWVIGEREEERDGKRNDSREQRFRDTHPTD